MFKVTQVLQAARYSRSHIRSIKQQRVLNEIKSEARKEARKRVFPAPQAQWFNKPKWKAIEEAQKVKEFYQQNSI